MKPVIFEQFIHQLEKRIFILNFLNIMNVIKGKVAIVTGGANGIGYSSVCALLEKEAKYVAIFDNTTENVWLDEVEEMFGKHRVELYHCDVSIEDEFKSNFDKVVEKYEYVDILINDAGIGNENDAGRLLDVNVKGTILGNLIAIEHMGTHKGGRGGVIVNVASVMGLLDCHVLPVYSASKHAVVSFTRSMKSHCEKIDVKIFAICPGYTSTKLNAELWEEYSYNYLDFVPKENIEQFRRNNVQSPENVSQAIIQLINEAEDGSVWVVQHDKPPFGISSADNYTQRMIDNHEASGLKQFFCW